MAGQYRLGASRRLALLGGLLLSAAVVAPAFAQIEEVTVTAQKKAEDIQTVPIAMTAFTSTDLAAHQISKFSDLQFAVPNVTYSQANFGGANFQVRGIGITAVGGGSESGVAINFADVYLAAPGTDEASYYDLQDLELLRGPQSTLYGRGANGGVVNLTPNKPNLDSFSSDLQATYGNYNAKEVQGMINIPVVTGQLGLRIAGDWIDRDGFTTNIADGKKQNDRDQYSVRGSVRWQPSDNTTVDLVVETDQEDDARGRADKELCAPDPTGVLGCTPAALTTGAMNLNATYLNILASKQGVAGVFGPAVALGTGLAGLAANPAFTGIPGAATELGGFETAALSGGNVPALLASLPTGTPTQALISGTIQATYNGYFAAGLGLGNAMGLTDTSVPFVAPANSNPSNYRQVNDDFDPINKDGGTIVSLEWKQHLTDWLDSVVVGGYADGHYHNNQSYTNTFGPPLGATNLAVAEGTFEGFLASINPALIPSYAQYFSVPGELPVSNFSGLGISSGSINHYSSNLSSYDQENVGDSQLSTEVRFNSDFDGPLNFMLGGYWLSTSEVTNYYVGSNSLDYAGILLGGVTSASDGLPAALIGPSYYHNIGQNIDLDSKSVFGEIYYDIVPDTLKLTLGARYNRDAKSEDARIGVLSGYIPIGTSDEPAALDTIIPYSRANGSIMSGIFDSTTGRAVLDWTPKLDFTDQTLVYASYSHGYKAGGFNPGLQVGIASGLSPIYGPETIDAYEIGNKNVALGGHLQANGDIWYYNYSGLQVSAIIDNTSINQNISAKLWGAEGELVWLPTDDLQFDVNLADTHSGITNTSEVDPRNPTGGYARAILIKDNSLTASANQNCVIYDNNPGPVTLPTGYTFVPSPSGPQLAQFVAPPGGQTALAGSGVPNVAFGSCSSSPQLQAFLAAQGYSESDPSVGGNFTGVPVNLDGNQLQQTPNLTFSIGAQYTFHLDDSYTLVPRVDYYWQSHMWGRIFHDPADLIQAWDVMNAQITLNSPDGMWYATAFMKNVFDKTYITGEYLTSSSSGLYTNAFLGDPRTYGLTLGVHF